MNDLIKNALAANARRGVVRNDRSPTVILDDARKLTAKAKTIIEDKYNKAARAAVAARKEAKAVEIELDRIKDDLYRLSREAFSVGQTGMANVIYRYASDIDKAKLREPF